MAINMFSNGKDAMNIKEIKREGIAINLDVAIEAFREKADKNAKKSGRLFDEDLNQKDLKFLDIGCGIGGHLIVLRNNGIMNAYGFDIVYKLVEIAKDEFGLNNLMVANGMNISLRNGSVDRVLFYNVIEHCSDPEAVMLEILRVLSPNGILYMDCPNANSMGDRIFRWGSILLYGKTSHIQKFTKKKIELIIQKAGFKIEKLITHRGIFVDYLQLKKFPCLKRLLGFLFGGEISGWELKLKKNS